MAKCVCPCPARQIHFLFCFFINFFFCAHYCPINKTNSMFAWIPQNNLLFIKKCCFSINESHKNSILPVLLPSSHFSPVSHFCFNIRFGGVPLLHSRQPRISNPSHFYGFFFLSKSIGSNPGFSASNPLFSCIFSNTTNFSTPPSPYIIACIIV